MNTELEQAGSWVKLKRKEHLGRGSRSPVTTLGVGAAATGGAATNAGLKKDKLSMSIIWNSEKPSLSSNSSCLSCY